MRTTLKVCLALLSSLRYVEEIHLVTHQAIHPLYRMGCGQGLVIKISKKAGGKGKAGGGSA